jgi:hypothetical protein
VSRPLIVLFVKLLGVLASAFALHVSSHALGINSGWLLELLSKKLYFNAKGSGCLSCFSCLLKLATPARKQELKWSVTRSKFNGPQILADTNADHRTFLI